MRLRDALDQSATGALRRMAAAHGLPHDEAATRAELLERLVDRLGNPAYLEEQLAVLRQPEHDALKAARASGGEIRGFLIERDAPGVASTLVERGFMFRTFASA